MQLTVSQDPVGAPIFYRDVPLMPSATEKGIIKPLPTSAIPLIEWRMRNISEPSSHVVMTDLHSCANCHSFSRDGNTMGLDMDGPQNNKGLYAVVPVGQKMTVRTQDMISWASFSGERDPQLRVGFMSQVSPDGKYVMTTIKPPGIKGWQFYYLTNFTDYRFLQVFYPTRGILAWYDRETKKLQPLPGADDPSSCKQARFGVRTGSTLFSRMRKRKTRILRTARWPRTQTTLPRCRFNTISTAFHSTAEGAGRQSQLQARRRTG